MSTALKNSAPKNVLAADSDFRFVIVTAEWNSSITYALRDGAKETLLSAGVSEENIRMLSVPGTVELTYAAARAIEALKPSAVIVIGCVIRGDTPHFDYVCQSVTQGITTLNAKGNVPVIFSVLTVENEEQAIMRAGGELGNKGSEGAATAISMAHLARTL